MALDTIEAHTDGGETTFTSLPTYTVRNYTVAKLRGVSRLYYKRDRAG